MLVVVGIPGASVSLVVEARGWLNAGYGILILIGLTVAKRVYPAARVTHAKGMK
jgi:hypothetical protein